jgi:pimeloyl-ACP methyl ester carboxylesterase
MLDRSQQHFEQSGAAPAVPLVMLPGTLCDARLFAPVLDLLCLPALTPQIAGASSAAELVDALLPTLPHRFSLCGFSLGAIVALELAARAPERIERLALIGCNPGRLSQEAARTRAAMSRKAFVETSGRHADPATHALIEDMADATSSAYRDQTRITLTRADSRPRLGRLHMPTLIVCGAQDSICPPALSIETARAIPGARLALIEGAGHYVTLERPDAVAKQLAAWLAMPANRLH